MQDTEEPTQAPTYADPAAPAGAPASRRHLAARSGQAAPSDLPAVSATAAVNCDAQGQGAELMVAQVVPMWARHLTATRDAAADGLGDLLQAFSDIAGALNTLSNTLAGLQIPTTSPAADQALRGTGEVKQAAEALAQQLDAALVHFQFGDRLNQTLDLVSSDMNRFTRWVANNPRATHGDALQWLAALEHSYTTDQQRATHQGKGPVGQGSAVEFF